MTTQEQSPLDQAFSVIKANQDTFLSSLDYLERSTVQLEEARDASTKASESVIRAQKRATTAAETLKRRQGEVAVANRSIESTARGIGMTIASSEEIEPLERTYLSLMYNDPALIMRKDPGIFKPAALEIRDGLETIIARLEPEEPILYMMHTRRFVGIVADRVSQQGELTVKPPEISEGHYWRSMGSVALSMPTATMATATRTGLASLADKPVEARLLHKNIEGSAEWLKNLASNETDLVIGHEAVSRRVEAMEPLDQFLALTAFKAVGVEIPEVAVNEEVSTSTEAQLVKILGFIASEVESTGTNPLGMLSRAIGAKSVRHMTEALGIGVTDLYENVESVLDLVGVSNTVRARRIDRANRLFADIFPAA